VADKTWLRRQVASSVCGVLVHGRCCKGLKLPQLLVEAEL
jgi:hypothetical protein